MNVAVAARIARRELRGGLKGFRVFLACLALGVAAIAAVGSVRDAIGLGLAREGAAILGGDAEIQLTYRFAEPAERAWMEGVSEALSEIVDFRSMAVVRRGGEAARGLTQVKAVDGAYPLYGSVALDPPIGLEAALEGNGALPGAVMDPVLMAQLQVEAGDRFFLGEREFVLTAALEREPDDAAGGFRLGPRTLVLAEDLEGSGLLAPGTLFQTAYRMRLAPGTGLAAMEAAATEALGGSGLRWRDSRNGAPGTADFVERLGAFLVLVGLAGLAVGGVGVSAAVRAYLERKTTVIATLKTLGAETGTVFLAYGLQIGALTLSGIGLGLALGAALPIAAAPLIEARLPVPAAISIHPRALAEAALYGALAAAAFTLWPLARTERIRAAALYRDAAERARALPRWPYLAATAATVGALAGAAAILSGLPVLALGAAAGLLAVFAALLVIAGATRMAARRLAAGAAVRGRPGLRMALGSIGGPGPEAGSVTVSLGLGLAVMASIGQIDANLRLSIARDLPDVAPSFFVVDIQGAQLESFLGAMEEDPDVERVETAPMLRGVITRINGRPASEVAGDHWVLQGDRGITYSEAPPPGTEITAGSWWPEGYDGPPQVSFAAEEAEEMGLALGDSLTINVLGRDVAAEVTSFREVDFSNAGLGFILSMNPAALAAAPHTHIATVHSGEASEPRLLREVSAAYPNVTMVRVRDVIARIANLLGSIAAAAAAGASVTLVTGLVVLVGAAAAGERARTYEAALLKTLGATRRFVLANFALRSALLGLVAGLVAIAAGAAGGWAVTTFVLDTDFRFEPVSAAAIVAGGMLTTLLAGLAFALGPLAARPAGALRDRE